MIRRRVAEEGAGAVFGYLSEDDARHTADLVQKQGCSVVRGAAWAPRRGASFGTTRASTRFGLRFGLSAA